MEKKLWSNAEVVELGVESTKNNETDEKGFFTCDVKGCYNPKYNGSNFCKDHQPSQPSQPPQMS